MAKIRYLGHAAFEIRLTGLDGREKIVLIDPWITNPLSPYKDRLDDYLRELGRVDYIIVTHDHGDHLGDAVYIAKRIGGRIVTIYDLAEAIKREGVDTIGANIGGRVSLDDVFMVLTPAYHSSVRGSPVGVVVGGRDLKVYHAGDTGLFAEMQYIGELYKPNVALLPIGGHFTMGVMEAVKAVELIKPEIAIPMHYNTFDLIKADPNEFKHMVEERTKTKVVVLEPGKEYYYPQK